jgi:site-specific DNA-cytosine methylase
VRQLKGSDITVERPTLVWASPPCQEFSRESMPWCRTGAVPSTGLVENCHRLIRELTPRYWVIENVRGAQRWLSKVVGKRAKRVGPFYLWGEFPIFTCELRMRNKMAYSGDQEAQRAQIPEKLSKALLRAIEAEL